MGSGPELGISVEPDKHICLVPERCYQVLKLKNSTSSLSRISVFCVNLRRNSIGIPMQHYRSGFIIETDCVCVIRGAIPPVPN